MKNKVIFIVIAFILFAFTFPLLINTNQLTNEKRITSNYCGCKSKPDYYIQVSLREIYVIVKDKEGRHIKDLNPSEFKLWEDGIEQKIVAVDKVDLKESKASGAGIEEKKTLQTKPIRYFTLVIGNVPERDIQKEKSKEAIRNFINNNIGPSDSISLYVMNQSSLELVVPFSIIAQESKAAALRYLEGENFGGNGYTPTRRGSLSRSLALDDDRYDDRYLRNMEFLNTAKFLESLCNGMQYINGKKDIILFSEGFFFDPDFSKDMAVQPISASAKDFRKFAQSKLGPSASTLVARLTDLKKSFIKYDIALQVIDLGATTNALADVGERHYVDGVIANQDSPSDYEKKRTQALLTISESSGGNYYPYSDTSNKLNRDLQDVDYSTSFYYIVSYSPGEQNDPDDYLPIKVEVSRDNAVLDYKKAIVVPENFENLNENEQNTQLNFISQSSMLYNMISICSSVALLPTKDDNNNLVFSLQIPLNEITKSDKKSNTVDLDIFITAFDINSKIVFNLSRELKVDLKKQTGKSKKKTMGLYCSTPIDEGEYRVRFFIRNRNNMLISSEEYNVTVPNVKDSPLALSSPLIFIEDKDMITVNLDTLNKEDKSGEKITALSSLPGVFTVSNEVKNNGKIRIGVAIKGLSSQEIAGKDRNSITLQAVKPMPKGSAGEPPAEIPFKVDDIIEYNQGTYLTLFELDISDLRPGYYIVMIKTVKDGFTASSSISLNVI